MLHIAKRGGAGKCLCLWLGFCQRREFDRSVRSNWLVGSKLGSGNNGGWGRFVAIDNLDKGWGGEGGIVDGKVVVMEREIGEAKFKGFVLA